MKYISSGYLLCEACHHVYADTHQPIVVQLDPLQQIEEFFARVCVECDGCGMVQQGLSRGEMAYLLKKRGNYLCKSCRSQRWGGREIAFGRNGQVTSKDAGGRGSQI
jgi:hypothetical protein